MMNSCSILVVLSVLASFASLPHFNNASFVSSTCSKAATVDPEISRDFCVTSLQTDVKSASANLTDLVHMSLNLAIKNTTSIISSIKYLLSNSKYAHLEKGLSCCQDEYSKAIDSLYKAVNQITKKPSSKYILNTRDAIYAAQDMVVYCWNYCDIDNEALYDPFFAKEDGNANQLYHMALMFLDKDAFKT